MITYRTPSIRQAARNIAEIVLLENRIVGHIKIVPNGFVYEPKGSLSARGATFPTVTGVRRSLES